ncbi:LPXTG cell wall anchor domain-containing protein [Actinomyces marmotae]|uniref:LPXTG cell wall anchor domain-containing protein n=1 Tax=Actinomyces marmotae TaxID=2737173 RepID=A0A6M8B0N3_9ACTO|nr:LPXTG cell wall anchor domain-containing protein [Actinomyces marmotae]QKD80104.1 LPXTG cell wall anchor domain-containing protein [Actinomyces marmotae]
MRLGRPLAITAAAVLAAGAVTTTATAAESDFAFSDDVARVADPASTAFPISGTGCTSTTDRPTEVLVTLAQGDPAKNPKAATPTTISVKPGTSNWSGTLNLAAAIKEVGADPTTEPWFLAAECQEYDKHDGATTARRLILDATKAEGTLTLKEDNGAQSFEFTGSGFTPAETVTLTLRDDNGKIVATLATMTADPDGKVSSSFPAPAGVPDGSYDAVVEGSRYGEGGTLEYKVTVSNGVFSYEGKGGSGLVRSANKPSANNAAADPAVAAPGAAQNAAAPAKEGLANTGADAMTFVIIGGSLATAGGLLLAARRRRA